MPSTADGTQLLLQIFLTLLFLLQCRTQTRIRFKEGAPDEAASLLSDILDDDDDDEDNAGEDDEVRLSLHP